MVVVRCSVFVMRFGCLLLVGVRCCCWLIAGAPVLFAVCWLLCGVRCYLFAVCCLVCRWCRVSCVVFVVCPLLLAVVCYVIVGA